MMLLPTGTIGFTMSDRNYIAAVKATAVFAVPLVLGGVAGVGSLVWGQAFWTVMLNIFMVLCALVILFVFIACLYGAWNHMYYMFHPDYERGWTGHKFGWKNIHTKKFVDD